MAEENEIYEYELIDITFETGYELPEEEVTSFVREDAPGIDTSNEEPTMDSTGSPQVVYDADGIPMGTSQQEKECRRKILHEFIQNWRHSHEDKRIFNENLKDYIRISQVFLLESVRHSVDKYQSTKAVLRFEEIMAKAVYVEETKAKEDDSNQKSFEKMIVMRYDSNDLCGVKMTVGIKNRTHEKVEYSITVPDPDEPFVDEALRIKPKQKSKKRKKHHR